LHGISRISPEPWWNLRLLFNTLTHGIRLRLTVLATGRIFHRLRDGTLFTGLYQQTVRALDKNVLIVVNTIASPACFRQYSPDLNLNQSNFHDRIDVFGTVPWSQYLI
ncbi:MAG: hypothetical protein KKB20_06755, partial [Proteobacteria bacterium]|nr:hypothetical protein [Pseudomonadota bacterium]